MGALGDSARIVLFGVVVVVGAVLAYAKVISGDAWLTLTLGLLLPSPLERKGGPGAGLGAGVSALVPVALALSLYGFAFYGVPEQEPAS